MRLCSTRCGRESVVGFSLDGIGIADAQAVLNSGICADPKGNETLHQRRLHAASVIATVLTAHLTQFWVNLAHEKRQTS
jgi:hypothetical protein